jgi:branched-chain amino acid transport system permease protein
MQTTLSIIVVGSIYTLFSLGLSLAWGVANILNLAHGAIFVAGALVAFEVGKYHVFPFAVMLPLAMLAGGLIAVVLDLVAFSPITRRAKSEHARTNATLLASIGAAAVITNIVNQQTGYSVQVIPAGVLTVSPHDLAGFVVTNTQVIIIVSALIATTALALVVRYSPHGRALRAVAYERDITPLFGVNAVGLSRATLFISGALAAGTGLLFAIHLSGFSTYSGDALLLKAFAVVILGGIGSVGGTALAAYGLAAVEIGVLEVAPSEAQDAVAFAVILLVLLLRPNGLFGVTRQARV